MRFQPVKCNMMRLMNKLNKIQASYTLDGTVLENVESIKYLDVLITNHLKWNTHISNKANILEANFVFLPPRRERSSLQMYGVPNSGVWKLILGSSL